MEASIGVSLLSKQTDIHLLSFILNINVGKSEKWDETEYTQGESYFLEQELLKRHIHPS